MIALPSSDATHTYVPCLIEVLGRPDVVVPAYRDTFEAPLLNPPLVTSDTTRHLDDLVATVRRIAHAPGSSSPSTSPRTRSPEQRR